MKNLTKNNLRLFSSLFVRLNEDNRFIQLFSQLRIYGILFCVQIGNLLFFFIVNVKLSRMNCKKRKIDSLEFKKRKKIAKKRLINLNGKNVGFDLCFGCN